MKDARKRVALVTCEALANLYEDDHLLVAALADIGIASVPAVWSDASIDWTSFDALIMRSPWDYFERVAEFRAWLDARIAERVLMCNSREILDWNFDKSYLQTLALAGVALVPTICIAENDKADIAALARARGWSEIVVKPTHRRRRLPLLPLLPFSPRRARPLRRRHRQDARGSRCAGAAFFARDPKRR